jgi:hypothetical protein
MSRRKKARPVACKSQFPASTPDLELTPISATSGSACIWPSEYEQLIWAPLQETRRLGNHEAEVRFGEEEVVFVSMLYVINSCLSTPSLLSRVSVL